MANLILQAFPKSSKIVLTSGDQTITSYGTGNITVEAGDEVTYTVSNEQCVTETKTITVSEDKTLEVALVFVGSVITDTIVPANDKPTSAFPTHVANLGKGGWQTVPDITARNNILDSRLSIGMAVYVSSENKLYIYKGKQTDPQTQQEVKVWEEFKSGSTDSVRKTTTFTDYMPLVSGEIVQYVGTTDTNYTNGYFYQGTISGETVTWTRVDVQPAPTIPVTDVQLNGTTVVSGGIANIEPEASDVDYSNTSYAGVTTVEDALDTILDTEIVNIKSDISDLKARGRFLSLWNCAEGKPATEPETEDAYAYQTGDYFIVGVVATTEGAKNYKPTGASYTKGQAASTVEETDEVSVDDTYYYDGSTWHLQVNHGKTVSFANLAGQPSDNTALSTALNAKQDVLTQGANISITTGEDGTVTISATDTTYTQGTGITIDASNQISVTDYNTIVSNASAGAGAATTIAGYGDIVTHNASEFITDISGKQDVLTSDNAGTNVSITTDESGKVVISATDTTYSQGTGITIDTSNQISANIATTSSTGIVKPDGTSITVAEDGTISSTAQESFFRGKFTTWANVPTSTELYNIDYHGSRIPTESDYMIVEDAEDYPVGEFSKEYKFVITGGGVNAAKLEVFDSNNLLIKSIAFGANVNKTFEIDNKLSIFVDGGAVHGWNINAIVDAKYNDHIYLAGERIVRVVRADSLNASIFVNSGEVVKLLGAWRFAYHGNWSTDGKQKWLPEYQIKDILPIATDTNAGIVKPDGVSITVDTDGTLKATAQETNYRGRWANYNAIPTDYTLYPEDSHGNKKPTYNDFVVVTDASDYVSPTNLNHELRITNLHATKAFTLLVIDEFDTANEYYYNDGFSRTWKAINDYYSLRYDPGVPGIWYIKTNKPEDTKIVVKNETYDSNDGTVLCYTNEPATQFSAGLPGATGQFQGTWRFAYYSEWDVDGRAGWKPQYQIENTLPIATATNPGIVKPDGTTITVATDGTLTATAQESHYRGKWNSWTDVPSLDTSYPEDYHGETTPTENDYIVVSNTSDFPVTDYNDSFEYRTDGLGHAYVTYQGETLHIPLSLGQSFVWNNKVEFRNSANVCVPKNISGSAIKIDDVVYQNNQNLPRALTQVKAYCITPLQGSWRFAYHGTWDTDNKNGWTPEYQLEDVLPIATEQEAGIAKLYTTTGTNTDGSMDQNSITTALGNKQDTLTAGTGIDITNNTISIIAVEIRDYTSNQ